MLGGCSTAPGVASRTRHVVGCKQDYAESAECVDVRRAPRSTAHNGVPLSLVNLSGQERETVIIDERGMLKISPLLFCWRGEEQDSIGNSKTHKNAFHRTHVFNE